MTMAYDRYQFIENIESVQGVVFLRQDSYDDIKANVYEGLTKHVAVIDTTDLEEDVTEGEGTGILIKLGLKDLIMAFFPPTMPEPLASGIESCADQIESLAEPIDGSE